MATEALKKFKVTHPRLHKKVSEWIKSNKRIPKLKVFFDHAAQDIDVVIE